ncbi:D-Ala-D-Ala carboxypeptidase family metallohydrolase [Tenacibaculum tangerinum]|uniref:D-Ala-D-Ala carboxypeptidase family metallohydrolase n=1 Tax=Tenacibaculum tangerinum TaxID=3038772 RepID=A0ABY8L7H3_9FLAO|nr:D-Ala-D-Ala carboxypeptidase family metallohydrolase [Tenacibaculum tangerinum]WGH76138.1 D-Ala-D-Ala carboxypeptidase family metallohydrolase [Tenacibaculum tangerinum]
MSNFLSPYRDNYPSNVEKYNTHLAPPLDGYNDNQRLSRNLTLGEIRKASSVVDGEVNLFTYIPLDKRLINAFQALRNALNAPIVVNSAFRSERHEKKQGRDGTSQHTYGAALDLRGSGLVELVKEALSTKNKLYQTLRAIGVNGFGVYENDNFIHIDVRQPKSDGGYAYWEGDEDDELKKKEALHL